MTMNKTPLPEANDPESADTRAGVQSVEIGMRLVEFFVTSHGPMPLREIAKGTGLGPSATHRYLVSFVRSGLLVQLSDQRYDLGPLALRLGLSALGRIDTLQIAIDTLDQFVADTGTTAMLSVWSERGPLVVRWRQGLRPVYTTIAVGSILPVMTSATGHVFLAWHDGATALSDGAHAQQIQAIYLRVRADGHADISGDLVPGLSAVAVPILDGNSVLVAVITAVSAGADIGSVTQHTLISSAQKTSASLGFLKT